MINVKINNPELAKDPKVEKYRQCMEKIMNKFLPEEKLDELQSQIMQYCITGEPYSVEMVDGNIVIKGHGNDLYTKQK